MCILAAQNPPNFSFQRVAKSPSGDTSLSSPQRLTLRTPSVEIASLALMSARLETSALGVESRIQPCNCQSVEPCLHGTSVICVVPPILAVWIFQGVEVVGAASQRNFGRNWEKPPGWMIRTQGLVTRGDLTAKRKESSGLFYCLPRAVEAAWGTTQTAAPLSWGHKCSVTVPREDIPPNEITSHFLLPALCISGV